MKIYVLLITFILLSCFSFANDGIINSSGGNLYIVKETNISIEKEILTFKESEDGMIVTVYFEFFNPDSARTETVGFISPPFSSPEDQSGSIPNIENFKVSMNKRRIPYKIDKVTNTEFISFLERQQLEMFAYYFKAKFKPGINIIKHSYYCKSSFTTGGVDGYTYYKYKLTTGKNWANGIIKDFELNIELYDLFTIPKDFECNGINNWSILGEGRIEENDGTKNTMENVLYVNLKSGKICYKKKDFKPEIDISIALYNPLNCNNTISAMVYGTDLSFFSDEEIRLAINFIYAYNNLEFNSSELKSYFLKYFWYTPDLYQEPYDRNEFKYQNLIDKLTEFEKNN